MITRRHRFTATALAGLLALTLSACGGGDDKPSSTDDGKIESAEYIYSSYNPGTTVNSQGFEYFQKRVTELSDGAITFKNFYSGALLPATEGLPGVLDGRADIAITGPAFNPEALHLINVVGVPFLAQDGDSASRALNDLYKSSKSFKKEFDDLGVHLVAIAPVGPNMIVANDKIESIADLDGKQVRGYGYVLDALKDVGASAVAMAQPDVYEAVERGVLDATSGVSLDLAIDNKFEEIGDYFIEPGFGQYALGINVMSLDKWNSLSPATQKVFDSALDDYLDEYDRIQTTREAEACAAAKKAGVEFVIWDDAARKEWSDQVSKSIEDKWIKDGVGFGYPEAEVQGFLDDYKAAIKANEPADYKSPVETCAAS